MSSRGSDKCRETHAAKAVGLGQSSMSHTLARLRAHFDDPLLVQVGRELVLTERAKSLIEPVADAVAQLERVFTQVEAFDPRTSSRVFRIAAADNLEFYLLPKLTTTLHRSAPSVQVRVTALLGDWKQALERGDIDLKLGRKYRVPSSLVTEDVSQESFTCAVRKQHPASARPSLQEYAAFEHMIVAPTAGPADEPSGMIDERLAQQGLRRRIVLSVPHFLVAPFVAASSDLVLTAPARLLRPFMKTLGLRRVQLPIKDLGYTLSQVWAARATKDPGTTWLRTTVARLLAAE